MKQELIKTYHKIRYLKIVFLTAIASSPLVVLYDRLAHHQTLWTTEIIPESFLLAVVLSTPVFYVVTCYMERFRREVECFLAARTAYFNTNAEVQEEYIYDFELSYLSKETIEVTFKDNDQINRQVFDRELLPRTTNTQVLVLIKTQSTLPTSCYEAYQDQFDCRDFLAAYSSGVNACLSETPLISETYVQLTELPLQTTHYHLAVLNQL